MTAYCKKCKKDVRPVDFCPNCGSNLTKASLRIAWCIRHKPFRDWMCWNNVLRLVLPVWAIVVLIILLPGLISNSPSPWHDPIQRGILVQLLILPVYFLIVLGIVLLLQSTDLIDCVVDSRGFHLRWYLMKPTIFSLLLHGLPPSAIANQDELNHVLLYRTQDLAWNEIARVQLWPEKLLVLLYAPRWWARLSIPCTGASWKETLDFTREKIGRKKSVILPQELTAPPKPKAPITNDRSAQMVPVIMLNDDPIDDQES